MSTKISCNSVMRKLNMRYKLFISAYINKYVYNIEFTSNLDLFYIVFRLEYIRHSNRTYIYTPNKEQILNTSLACLHI